MKTVELTVQLKRSGSISLLVTDGDRFSFLPIREIQNWDDVRDAEPGDAIDVEIPEWLAIKEGLV